MSGNRDDWEAQELDRARQLAARLGQPGDLFAARAPGRVNLIGEHTDYSGLPVLPAAIDRSTIVVATARADNRIELSNIDPLYPARSFQIEERIPSYPAGDWANYAKAAIQSVIDHFAERGRDAASMRGANLIIDGRVPVAAGLSSSAALTIASTLAFMAVNGLDQPALETAQMAARSEWYVGTMAGGMDQAASMLGRRDHALFIQFNPLRAAPVAMPADAALIVADSGEIADKSGRVREEYNRRVVECSIAARIIGRALRIGHATILGDIVKALDRWSASELVGILANRAPDRLSGGIREASAILSCDERMLRAELLGSGSSQVRIDESRPLEIMRRARHVLSETERVMSAVQALSAGDLPAMGAMMDASHRSLRDDFDASTPRLDRMVECAREAGAFGARLTGAGFGGCMIALADRSRASAVLEGLERNFYTALDPPAAPQTMHAVLHAAPGASVVRLERE